MRIIFFISLLFFISSCETDSSTKNNSSEKLKIIGKLNKETGKVEQHTIRPFSFMNQDSQEVNNATFTDKIYIADFFFIHCPTICPAVKTNMKYIYDTFENNDTLVLLSHSIDTKHDTIPALKAYAEKLEIETKRWHFVTGNKSEIYSIAEDYISSAKEDESEPGGFDHSGYLVLIDKKGHVRSFARGTDRTETDRLILDIKKLLKEYQ